MRNLKEAYRISFYELIEGLSKDETMIVSSYLDFDTATNEELICMINNLQEKEQEEIYLILSKRVRTLKKNRITNNIRTILLYAKHITLGIIISLLLIILSRVLKY